ncbi:G-type lectin S-receptor-like serine/threonine-protein kinase At1g61430 [Prunus avium]|uniref:G-type lectin S-receptor-like serine/threonine-protein kinase At1g61430 n=1 Tax=Prunus avium TaxID=42229 RepID=A0A6P5S3W1_PRUAV|nr:G-type lectin S-receptor-like serine/threonine-protein kinase At1g61430 [Prunus avium]
MGGMFSEKSDVYSFGVLLLEIISGKKNTSFYCSDQQLGFLAYDNAADRPTMPDVISMLSTETDCPQPNRPIFTVQKSVSDSQPQYDNIYSGNEATITLIQGR